MANELYSNILTYKFPSQNDVMKDNSLGLGTYFKRKKYLLSFHKVLILIPSPSHLVKREIRRERMRKYKQNLSKHHIKSGDRKEQMYTGSHTEKKIIFFCLFLQDKVSL